MAFVLGAAAGLAAGFLLAPEKGEKIRRKLSAKAGEFKDELKDHLDRENLKELANLALTEVEKYGHKISEVVKD